VILTLEAGEAPAGAVPEGVRLAALPVRRALVAAASVGAAAVVEAALARLRPELAIHGAFALVGVVIVVTTMALAGAVIRRALRAATSRGAAGWCLVGAAGAGMVDVALGQMALLAAYEGTRGLITGVVVLLTPLGMFIMLALGGVPGAAVGLAAAPLLASGRALEAAPSLRDGRAVAVTAGLWLFGTAAVAAWQGGGLLPLGCLAGAAGLGLLAAAVLADLRLVAWQRRLGAAGSPWRLVPRDPARDESVLPPLGRWGPAALCEQVLVHEPTPAAGLGPYRTAVRALPVALVPRDLAGRARQDLVVSVHALAACALLMLSLLAMSV
jgi:hypothetical protein